MISIIFMQIVFRLPFTFVKLSPFQLSTYRPTTRAQVSLSSEYLPDASLKTPRIKLGA